VLRLILLPISGCKHAVDGHLPILLCYVGGCLLLFGGGVGTQYGNHAAEGLALMLLRYVGGCLLLYLLAPCDPQE
jgi:hypothetical protein